MVGWRTARMGGGSRAGIFTMIALTATVAAGAGQIIAVGAPGPGRFAAADAVVRAEATVRLGHGDNVDKVDVQRSALLPVSAPGRVRSLAGVRSAVGDVAFPVTVIGRHAAADAGDPRAYDRVQLVAVVASSGGITLAISIFVLAGTVAFAAERRRRQFALLRAIGATPGQVRGLLLRETAVLGLLAGAAGCAAAMALYGVFTNALVSVGLAPDGFVITPSWIPYVIAVGVGVVVAVLATLLAARRALAVRPGEALAESLAPPRRMSPVRALLGVLAFGGGLTLGIVLASSALAFGTLAVFLFMIAVALLGPLVLGWPAVVAGPALPSGGAGFLARSGLTAGRFRIGAVGAAVALVVALTGTQVLSIATAQRATQRVASQRVRADYVLVPRVGDGLPPTLARAAARVPSISAAAGMVSTEVFLLDSGAHQPGQLPNAPIGRRRRPAREPGQPLARRSRARRQRARARPPTRRSRGARTSLRSRRVGETRSRAGCGPSASWRWHDDHGPGLGSAVRLGFRIDGLRAEHALWRRPAAAGLAQPAARPSMLGGCAQPRAQGRRGDRSGYAASSSIFARSMPSSGGRSPRCPYRVVRPTPSARAIWLMVMSAGKLQLHIFASLAEFERELIRERSQAGREVAKAAGWLGGRPVKLTPEKRAAALAMRERGDKGGRVRRHASLLGLPRRGFDGRHGRLSRWRPSRPPKLWWSSVGRAWPAIVRQPSDGSAYFARLFRRGYGARCGRSAPMSARVGCLFGCSSLSGHGSVRGA